MEALVDQTWINHQILNYKLKLNHVWLTNNYNSLRSVGAKNINFANELLSIGIKLQKLLNRSEQLLVTKYASRTCPSYVIGKWVSKNGQRNRWAKFSSRNSQSTTALNRIRPKFADLCPPRCQTFWRKQTLQETNVGEINFVHAGQNNSARPKTFGVRFEKSSHSSFKQSNGNMRPSRRSQISQSLKQTPNEVVQQKVNKDIPPKKASLKMIPSSNKSVEITMNEDVLAQDAIIHQEDKSEYPTNDEIPFIEKLILELDDSDTEPNSLGKTTVQIQFQNPSTGNLNPKNRKTEQIPRHNKTAEKETQSIQPTTNDQPDIDYKAFHDVRLGSYLHYADEPPSGRKSELSTKNGLRHSGPGMFTRSKLLPQFRSQPNSPRTAKSNKSYRSGQPPIRKVGPKNWYEPVVRSRDYEQEVKHLLDNDSKADFQDSHVYGLEGNAPEIDDEENFENDKFQVVSSTKPTLERSMSLDTLEMLKAVEQPEVIDSISRRLLEREILRNKSPAPSAKQRNQTKALVPKVSPEFVSSSPVAQLSPRQRTADRTRTPPTASPTVFCYPFVQPLCFPIQPVIVQPPVLTDIRPCVPSLSPVSTTVTSSPMSVYPMHQLSPTPVVHGPGLLPNFSPTLLQQTVFIPSSFHSITYQPF